MSKLGIIIKQEYLTDIKRKSFWISTFVLPLVIFGFSMVAGFLFSESDTAMSLQESFIKSDSDTEISVIQVVGMLLGMFLSIFLMMYGSQIYTKVHFEKANRIVEILATCVDGKTLMLGKIISVCLTGLTQIFLWGFMLSVMTAGILIVFPIDFEWLRLLQPKYIMALVWCVLFFIGGYMFYGSLFAAVGAMSDKNSENQEYMAVLTFVLLFSFYIGAYAADHGNSLFVRICEFIPFTSPTICTVNASTGVMPVWETILALAVLYLFAYAAMSLSGKIYTISILLKGKRFSPADIITFIKAK